MLLAFWPGQVRAPGEDPPREPIAPWIRAVVGGAGVALFILGIVLYLAPTAVADVWPWPLTPLTARVLGSWATGLGLVFGFSAYESDRLRMRAPMAGLAAFGGLELLALLRFGSDVARGRPAAWSSSASSGRVSS